MFIIQRVDKRNSSAVRGIQMENNRTPDMKGKFPLSKIDWTKTDQNIFLRKTENWLPDIKRDIAEHGILSYRKNAILLVDVLYTASPEFFIDKSADENISFFNDCLQFHEETYGKALNSVVHVDETTPHMHTVSIPYIKEGDHYRLSARDLIGPSYKLAMRQTLLYEKVGKKYDLERGEPSDSIGQKKHLSIYELKLQTIIDKIDIATVELADLEKQCRLIEAKIDHSAGILDIQSLVKDLADKISVLTGAITEIPIDTLQSRIEHQEILIDSNISSALCTVEHIIFDGTEYSYIISRGGDPLSWNGMTPLFVQDGFRYIPTGLVSTDREIYCRDDSILSPDFRDPISSSLADQIDEIRQDIDLLQDKTDDHLPDDIESDEDPVDDEYN